MSCYFVKGKGWRTDFIHKGIRYTRTWFKTKNDAKQAGKAREGGAENPKNRALRKRPQPTCPSWSW